MLLAIIKEVEELETATVGPRGTRILGSDLTAEAKVLCKDDCD